jgi:hypothetical protein
MFHGSRGRPWQPWQLATGKTCPTDGAFFKHLASGLSAFSVWLGVRCA